MTDDQIIEENERRIKSLFCEYNPSTGIGSQIERFPLKIYHDKPEIYLPNQLRSKYGKIKCLEDEGDNFEDTFMEFMRDRLMFDFEFWAYWCIKIKPKGESGGLVPFRLNWPQRFMLSELIKMLFNNIPVRAILVKARQWGGSTLVQMFMMWIQVMHKTYWNSSIVADVEAQALGIRAMYEQAVKNYRPGVQNLSFKTYSGNSDWKEIPERNCVISIGSMQKPDKNRQQDISMVHASEVGIWKKTEGKTPEDLVQSLYGSVLSVPYSVFVLESTAKGQGNYFHTTYLQAERGENNYKPVFIPWWQIELYHKPFSDKTDKVRFLHTLNEYEISLWDMGAALEGIAWYRTKLKDYNNNKWRMGNEFPSTVAEAFSFSSRPVFNPSYVKNLELDIRDPDFIGDIFPQAAEGDEAFKDIRVEPLNEGPFAIWAMPNDPPIPEGKIMKNRYAIFVDIGGTSKEADYSAITVIDRYYMAQGGIPEAVATWHGHLDQDLLAWKAAQIAKFYDNAYLGFEVNSLNTIESDTEGDHSYIILDKIANYYDNLYTRTTPEQIKNGIAVRWGFHTNSKTKGMIVDNYRGIIRNSGYVEYDIRAYNEASWYIVKENGKIGNVDGQHDDILITRMGALWLATSEDSGMGLPEIIDAEKSKIILRKPIIKTAAKF